MSYVDGFIVPVPKKKLDAYKRHRDESRQGLEGSRRASTTTNASPTT